MKTIYFFITALCFAWIFPSNIYSEEVWISVRKGERGNFIKTFNQRKGLCQVLFKKREVYLRVVEETSCSQVEQITLTIDSGGRIKNVDNIFYGNNCKKPIYDKKFFIRHCLVLVTQGLSVSEEKRLVKILSSYKKELDISEEVDLLVSGVEN